MLRFTPGTLAMLIFVAVESIAVTDELLSQPAERAQADSDWEAKIEKALGAEFSFSGVDVPLREFANQISEKAGITVLVDRLGLDDVGISDDVPLTRNLSRISLRSVLRLVLKELDLTYELRDGALVITTPRISHGRTVTRWYDVRDLGDAEPPDGSDRYDCEQLMDIITFTVSPYSWEHAGGQGAIRACRGHLVVVQFRDVHRAVVEILAAIRKAKSLSRSCETGTPPVAFVDTFQEDSAVQRIRNALRQPITVAFDAVPLPEVVGKLREQGSVNIEIDTRSLNDVSISTDWPITFHAKDMRLDFVLRHVLEELDLTYVIRDEVVLITTPEEGEECLHTRLFLVGDLLGPVQGRDWFGDPVRPMTMEELIAMITTIVAPNCWECVGGPGSVERFSSEDLLVVTQTDDVHDQIVATLTRFRESLAAASPTAEPGAGAKPGEKPVRMVVYFLPAPSSTQEPDPFGTGPSNSDTTTVTAPSQYKSEELATLIEELIQVADEDTRNDAYVGAFADRLVIRHTDCMHKQIEKLLTKLRVWQADDSQQPWTGGGSVGGMF